MPDYSSISYRNNFLNQVIIRADFLQFVPTSMAFSDSVEKEILKNFPRRGKDQIIRFNSINVVFDPHNNGLPNTNGEILDGIQREYFTNDGLNKLALTNKFIVLEINKYSSFEEHRQWFQSILLAFFQKNRISVNRTGIRYINMFQNQKVKPQKNFFAPDIAASISTRFTENDGEPCVIRSMHMTEYRIDEMTMNFRYGMFNPDYPNLLKKNDFVLDYDFFSNDVIDSADGIVRVLDKGHYEIQSLFEQSITDSLRKVMNNEQLS